MGLRTQKTCRDFPKPLRTDKIGTTRNSQEKDRTVVTTNKVGKKSCVIRRKTDTKTSK